MIDIKIKELTNRDKYGLYDIAITYNGYSADRLPKNMIILGKTYTKVIFRRNLFLPNSAVPIFAKNSDILSKVENLSDIEANYLLQVLYDSADLIDEARIFFVDYNEKIKNVTKYYLEYGFYGSTFK